MMTAALTALTGLIRSAVVKADVKIEGSDLLWGTYGKSGKEPLKWVKLGDCDTEHLQNILRTQAHVYAPSPVADVIKRILIHRDAKIPDFIGLRQKYVIGMILMCFCFSGCADHNSPEILAKNKAIISTSGQEVGVLPDGRRLIRYEIEMGIKDNHWVYIVNGSDSITVNHSEQNGEDSSSNHVEVFINGVRYNLSPVVEKDPNR